MSGCGRSPVAGGTTDTGNSRVAATIYKNDGSRVKGASVTLRSKNFLSVVSGAGMQKDLVRAKETFTDDSGYFEIDSIESGDYFIEVNDRLFSAALLTATVSGMANSSMFFTDTLRPYAGITGNTSPPSGPSVKMYLLAFGLERRILIDSTGHFEIKDLPSGTLRFRIVSQDAFFNPIDIDSIVIAPGKIDTVPFAGWGHSTGIFLNTTASGADIMGLVTHFPILVRLTSSNFNFPEAKTNGYDIRFAKSDNAQLSYEIERWDAVNQQAEIWVKMDTVYGNDSTHFITMYWGNPSAPGVSNAEGVFDTASGFQGVWHLNEAGNATAYDATGNHYNGTPQGMAALSSVPGVIGLSRQFDGTSSYFAMPNTANSTLNLPENGYYTVSAWANTNFLEAKYQGIVYKSNWQYGLQIHSDSTWEFFEYKDGQGWESTSDPAIAGSWYNITGVRAGIHQYLYVNGVCVDSIIVVGAMTNPRITNMDLQIGHCQDGGLEPDRFFNGKIDEVRIANIALNADWIKLCYMNQRADDKLVVFK